MSDPKAKRLKECYRIANEIIQSEHPQVVQRSHACQATLSISAAILACKLFDSDFSHPEKDEPLRADLLDLSEETDEKSNERL